MNQEEKKIDFWTNQIQESLNQLTKDPSFTEYAYVTYDDIKNLPNLTDFPNETLLAVRAPPGTNLEVPDPDYLPPEEKERYQILLHSSTGEMLVYVISSEKNIGNNIISTNPSRISPNFANEIKKIRLNDAVNKQETIPDLFLQHK